MAPSNKKIGAKIKQPRSLSEKVAEVLLDEIKQGTIRGGETLPPEAELADNFGVSRTVIREALARLKSDGLLETQQGRGATIVENGHRRTFRLEAYAGGSRERPNYLFELRAILEGDAAALAALRRNDQQLRSMQTCLQEMQTAVDEKIDGTTPDFRFHRAISRAAGNPYLLEFMKFLNFKLIDVTRSARQRSSLRVEWPEIVQKEHVAIFEAIADERRRSRPEGHDRTYYQCEQTPGPQDPR